MPAQLSERPTAATEEAAPPWPTWPPTAAEHRDQGAGPPPPPDRPAADGTGGRRWSWPRRLSTAMVALAIALTGGMAGAYTATRLDDDRVVTTPAAATVATTGAVNASLGQDAGSIGVGFAIPSQQVARVVGQLTGTTQALATSSTTG